MDCQYCYTPFGKYGGRSRKFCDSTCRSRSYREKNLTCAFCFDTASTKAEVEKRSVLMSNGKRHELVCCKLCLPSVHETDGSFVGILEHSIDTTRKAHNLNDGFSGWQKHYGIVDKQNIVNAVYQQLKAQVHAMRRVSCMEGMLSTYLHDHNTD